MCRFRIFLILCCIGISGFSQTPENKRTKRPQRGERIVLNGWQIFPTQTETGPEAVLKSRVFHDRFYFVLVFKGKIDGPLREEIQKIGIQLLDYIPHQAFFASGDEEGIRRVAKLEMIKAILPVHPEWKRSKKLFPGIIPAHAVTIDGDWKVLVSFFTGVFRDSALNIMKHAGFFPDEPMTRSRSVQVTLKEARVLELLSFPFVQFMEPVQAPPKSENLYGRTSHRSNAISGESVMNPGFNGEGVKIALNDDGDIGPHIDFQGRTIQVTSGDNGTHGDHVGGTIAGAGNLNPDAKGMAWGATLYVYNVWDELHTADLLYNSPGIRITSTSYADGCNDGYTAFAAELDEQVVNRPALLHVFSAGNEGQSDCDYGAGSNWGNVSGGNKVGKNVIAVGNLNRFDALVASSSRGPAADGRIKPEVCAVGKDVYSAYPGNQYNLATGTSMSCPGVSGTAAQLFQMYKFYHGNADPEASFQRGLLMVTADDLQKPGPDYKTGFGRINAYRAGKVIKNGWFMKKTAVQNSDSVYTITIPAGMAKLNVMIVWTDPSATPGASPALVNDLDLEVTDPGMNTTLPFVLNPFPHPDSLNLPAVQGVDSLNNQEMVSINNPVAGNYEVRVTGFDVPSGNQSYFIIYEMLPDSIFVTYPRGNESMQAGGFETIRWNAVGNTGTFSAYYSTDSGSVWNLIASNISDTARSIDWPIPLVVTPNALVKVVRGGNEGKSDSVFSVIGIPNTFVIDWDCEDSLQVSWSPVNGAGFYELSRLGQKYMDSIGTTTDTFFVVHGLDPSEEDWFGVKAREGERLIGKRRLAIPKIPGENGCITSLKPATKQQEIGVFPNPTHGNLWIHGLEGILNIEITDATGRQVHPAFSPETNRLDFSGMAAGIYFIQVHSGVKRGTYKVIKL